MAAAKEAGEKLQAAQEAATKQLEAVEAQLEEATAKVCVRVCVCVVFSLNTKKTPSPRISPVPSAYGWPPASERT